MQNHRLNDLSGRQRKRETIPIDLNNSNDEAQPLVHFKQRFDAEFFTDHKRRCCISERSDFALIDLSLGRFRRVHISIAHGALIVPGRWSVR